MTNHDKLYHILRWRRKVCNWPRHDVIPMPVIEENDCEVVEEGLTFADADAKRKELESQEVRKLV